MMKRFGLIMLFVIIHFSFFHPIRVDALESKKAHSFEGKIVFVNSNNHVDRNIYLLDGKIGKTKKLTNIGDNLDPKWSPDGKKISFISKRKDHSWEIFVMDAKGKDQTRLTYTASGFSTQPRWSGGGRGIYFFSNNLKGTLSENFLNLLTGAVRTIHTYGPRIESIQIKGQPLQEYEKVEALKEEVERATKEAEDILRKFKGDLKICPSPDGRHFLINYSPYPGKLVLINIDTKSERTIEMECSYPAWAKDSKKIAFMTRDPFGTLGVLAIYDMDENKTEKILIPKKENEDCSYPSWSKDSRKIVYVTGPVAGPGAAWLYVIDLKTRTFSRLIQGYLPDWY